MINGQPLNDMENGWVNWQGLFGQREYKNDHISAFLHTSISNQGYRALKI